MNWDGVRPKLVCRFHDESFTYVYHDRTRHRDFIDDVRSEFIRVWEYYSSAPASKFDIPQP